MGLFDFLGSLFGGGRDDDADGNVQRDDGEADDDVTDVTEFGPAEFRREAEEFAADHEDEDFDFTIESLERLDEYAASQTAVLDALDDETDESAGLTGGVREGYILWFGSYFGEVVVREFDGEWVTDGDGVHVEVPAGDTVSQVPPLNAAAIAVEDDPQFAAMVEELRREIDRAEDGADPAPSVGGGEGDGDGSGDANVEARPIPTVDLEPGTDLDAAHQRAVAAFDEAGYYVTEGTVMNSVDGPLSGTAKLFNFHDDAGMYTGVVYPGEWTDEVANGVLSLASSIRPDPADGVFVVSPTDPPAPVEYVTGAHPRGAFSLDAMHAVQNGPVFVPGTAPDMAEHGRKSLATHFDVHVDVDDLAALETIDDIVLSEIRTVEDREAPQDGYVPHEALLVLGTLAGEVMRRGFERDHDATTEWVTDESVSSTGVALSVASPDGNEMTVNPAGKAFKLFENGESDSIAFMYQTSVAAMQDEL